MRRLLLPALAALSVATFGLSACSSSSKSVTNTPAAGTTSSAATNSSAATSSSVTPTSASASATTSSAPSAAGQRYISITSQAQADAVAFSALNQNSPIAQIHAAAAKLAADYPVLISKLQAGPWPTNVQGAVTTLIGTCQALEPLWTKAASAASGAAVQHLVTQYAAQGKAQAAAATAVKAALGLPTTTSS